MERLTEWIEGKANGAESTPNGALTGWYRRGIFHATACVEKLSEYEDLEEKGLLMKLPCAVGDTIYTNMSWKGWYFREKNRPYKAKVVFIGINGADSFMNVDFGNGRMLQFNLSDIGKTIFLTREEAEQALKEMESK